MAKPTAASDVAARSQLPRIMQLSNRPVRPRRFSQFPVTHRDTTTCAPHSSARPSCSKRAPLCVDRVALQLANVLAPMAKHVPMLLLKASVPTSGCSESSGCRTNTCVSPTSWVAHQDSGVHFACICLRNMLLGLQLHQTYGGFLSTRSLRCRSTCCTESL